MEKKTTKTKTVSNKTTKKSKRISRKIWVSVLCFALIIGYAIWYTYYANPEQKNKIDEIVQTTLGDNSENKEYEQKTLTQNSVEKKDNQIKNENKKITKKEGFEYSSKEADLGYSENDPLFLGNPSDSIQDLNHDENYTMIKKQYTLSYNAQKYIPNWVAWHLEKSDLGSADRSDDFRPDKDLPKDWYGIKKADYQYNIYGFDRGHVCPSADRTATMEDNSMTFLMTNMVPQSPDNNRVIWMHFENYERELVNQGMEVYIIAGPYGKGGNGGKGDFESISVKLKNGETIQMEVPAFTWKVLIAIPQGQNDMSRINENSVCIAINVPNQMGMGKTGDWEQFITTVDEIENLTGYDFFELLPDDIEEKLESSKYVYKK